MPSTPCWKLLFLAFREQKEGSEPRLLNPQPLQPRCFNPHPPKKKRFLKLPLIFLRWKVDGATLIMSHHGKNRCSDTEGERKVPLALPGSPLPPLRRGPGWGVPQPPAPRSTGAATRSLKWQCGPAWDGGSSQGYGDEPPWGSRPSSQPQLLPQQQSPIPAVAAALRNCPTLTELCL